MRCETCFNWFEFPTNGKSYDRKLGSCRLNPPIVIDSLQKGKWPTTDSNQWCGQYKEIDSNFEDPRGL